MASVIVGKDDKGYKVSIPRGDTYRASSLKDAEFLARIESTRIGVRVGYAPGVKDVSDDPDGELWDQMMGSILHAG